MAQAVVRLTKRQITTADEPSVAELRAELARKIGFHTRGVGEQTTMVLW